jgi:hypothetical protein
MPTRKKPRGGSSRSPTRSCRYKGASTSRKINEPFLVRDRGSPAEYGAGLKLAIERGWLAMHDSGTFDTFAPAGAELFA